MNGDFYNIINVFDKGALDITCGDCNFLAIACEETCITSKFSASDLLQRWEFLIPRVDVPAGWVRIRNVSSGAFLQHNYLSSPPFLAPAQCDSNVTNLRETWGAQWALILPSEHKIDSAHNGWCIKNRLTARFLNVRYMRFAGSIRDAVKVADSIHKQGRWQKWELEINQDGYWKIKNMASKDLLEKDWQNLEELIKDGVTCIWKKHQERDGAELWEFL
ncbi:hypothetical protein RUND412_004523 [Rhizina undulata]